MGKLATPCGPPCRMPLPRRRDRSDLDQRDGRARRRRASTGPALIGHRRDRAVGAPHGEARRAQPALRRPGVEQPARTHRRVDEILTCVAQRLGGNLHTRRGARCSTAHWRGRRAIHPPIPRDSPRAGDRHAGLRASCAIARSMIPAFDCSSGSAPVAHDPLDHRVPVLVDREQRRRCRRVRLAGRRVERAQHQRATQGHRQCTMTRPTTLRFFMISPTFE